MIVTSPTGKTINYECYLTDDKGVRLAFLDNFIQLDCSRVANQIAAFSMVMPLSFDRNMIAPDRMVQIWREPTGGRLKLWRVYFLRRWLFDTQGSNDYVTLAGPDVNDLLRRRIVAAYSGSAQASKTDYADDMMKEVVTQSIADGVAPTPTAGTRVWSDLSITGDVSLGPTITKSFPFGKLLNKSNQGVLATIAKAAREEGTEVFFDIVPNVVTSNSINFKFITTVGQPGQDVSDNVVFSQDSGNLENPSLEYDYAEEENYIYAAGQGEGSDRNVQQVYDNGRYNVSQWNRCEGFADARDQTTDNGVTAAGNDALNAGRPKIRFRGSPIDTASTRFGIDWDYGYRVQTKYANIQFDSIIRAVTLSVNDQKEEDIQTKLDFEALL